MGLNTGSNSSWEKDDKKNNEGFKGLTELFSNPSMTSDSRSLRETSETQKALKEFYEALENSTSNAQQKKIIPTVETLTQGISPVLPGLGLSVAIGGNLYVMPVLFSNSTLTTSTERITTSANNSGMMQNVSIPIPPSAYINKALSQSVEEHYRRIGDTSGISKVSVINAVVVDLDMWNHTESGDPKEWPQEIAKFIAGEWEEGIMIKASMELVEQTGKLPNSWQTPEKPYGNDGCAEARVMPITGSRVNRGKVLTSSNIEVVTSTINNNHQNMMGMNNSKEICRVTATVRLMGVTYNEYLTSMRGNESLHGGKDNLERMINMLIGSTMAGNNCYSQGYKPLRPVIEIDTVTAGEVLQNHNGLYPYFYGLYQLIVANNRYAFAEGVRRLPGADRSSLIDLETRITQMISSGNNVLAFPANKITLNEKNITDVDLVNQWLQQNCSPHLSYQVNLLTNGPNSSIHNFLFRLAGKNNSAEVKVVTALIDAMTGNKFSDFVAENLKNSSGWNPSKPILIPTQTMTVNGITTFGGRRINTTEVDEQMVCHIRGNKNHTGIDNYLRAAYGVDNNENFKQRAQKLRVDLSYGMFDTDVAINGFGHIHVWNPEFLQVMAKAYETIGNMSIANSFGAWKVESNSYAPGAGLALTTSIGNSIGNNMGYNFI